MDCWWDQALCYIKAKSDHKLSREMNWITKDIIAYNGFRVLEEVTAKIGEQLIEAENQSLR